MWSRPVFLCGALLFCADALAQTGLRRVATYGDPEPTSPGWFVTEAKHPAIGSGGLVAYIAEAGDGFGGRTEVVRIDDHGVAQTIAYAGQVIDGTTLSSTSVIVPPLQVAGSLVLFEANATPADGLYVWDAGNGARRVISRGDAVPGGGVVENLAGAQVNVQGQVLLHSTTSTATGAHVFVDGNGVVSTVLRRDQTVPGFGSYTIAQFGMSYLHNDGQVTVEVMATDGTLPVVQEWFVLQGPVGALTVAASTRDLPGPNSRSLTLLGAAPAGPIAYATVNTDADDDATLQVHVGAAGATTVVLTMEGDNLFPLGGGYSLFDLGAGFLADGNEFAAPAGFDHAATVEPGIVAFHDDVWSVVVADDTPLPDTTPPNGPVLLGVNPLGQVAFYTGTPSGRALWRSTPGAPPTRIAAVGDAFEVGQDDPVTPTSLGFTLPGPSAISNAGDVAFYVGWVGPDAVPTTSIFTTTVGEGTDAFADLSVRMTDYEYDRDEARAIVQIRVANEGPDPTAYELRFRFDPANVGFACPRVADYLSCSFAEALPSGQTAVHSLEVVSGGDTIEGEVEVLATGALDRESGNNAHAFTLELVEEGAGGCAKSDVAGLSPLGGAAALSALVQVCTMFTRARTRRTRGCGAAGPRTWGAGASGSPRGP